MHHHDRAYFYLVQSLLHTPHAPSAPKASLEKTLFFTLEDARVHVLVHQVRPIKGQAAALLREQALIIGRQLLPCGGRPGAGAGAGAECAGAVGRRRRRRSKQQLGGPAGSSWKVRPAAEA